MIKKNGEVQQAEEYNALDIIQGNLDIEMNTPYDKEDS